MRLFPLALKNLRLSARRTFLSGAAIFLSAFLTLFILSMIYGVVFQYKDLLTRYVGGEIQIRDSRFFQYEYLNPLQFYVDQEESLRRNLLTQEGITKAVSRIHIPGEIYWGDRKKGGYGLGVNLSQEVMDFDVMLLEGRYPEGGKPEGVIGHKMARDLDLKTGDKFTILTQNVYRSPAAATFTITGIVRFPNLAMGSWFLTSLEMGQRLLAMPEGASEVLLFYEGDQSLEAVAQEISAILPPGLEARDISQVSFLWDYMVIAEIAYTVIAVLFVVMGCTVIFNTMMMVVYERIKEIGILSAMGITPREITRLFFLESLLVSSISASGGLTLSSILVYYLGKKGLDLSSMVESMEMDYPTILYPLLDFKTIGVSFILAIGVTSLVTLIPARKAARMKPIEALRY